MTRLLLTLGLVAATLVVASAGSWASAAPPWDGPASIDLSVPASASASASASDLPFDVEPALPPLCEASSDCAPLDPIAGLDCPASDDASFHVSISPTGVVLTCNAPFGLGV